MLINVYIFQMRKEAEIVSQCETPQTKVELDDLKKSSEGTDRRVISSKYSPLSSTSLYNLTPRHSDMTPKAIIHYRENEMCTKSYIQMMIPKKALSSIFSS